MDRAGPFFVPARCGMIYMEPHQLGWKPLKDSYMDTLPASLTEEHKELVRPSCSSPSPPSLSPYSSFLIHLPNSRMQAGARNSLPVSSYHPSWLPDIFPAFSSLWQEWDSMVNFSFYLLRPSLSPQWRILMLEQHSTCWMEWHTFPHCPTCGNVSRSCSRGRPN